MVNESAPKSVIWTIDKMMRDYLAMRLKSEQVK